MQVFTKHPMLIPPLKTDMEINTKFSPIFTELFLKGKKLNISIVFISQSYFKEPETIRPHTIHHTLFNIKKTSKREFQQIASNHSSHIKFKDFMKLYKNYTKEPFSFLVNNTTLTSSLGRTYYKMAVNKKMKKHVEQNKAQYNSNRQTAKISASSSGNVVKHEFLSDKDV